jgi:NADPH:quinone reductase
MRAIQVQRFGGPEVLELVELPDPEPGPGEVLIEVRKAGVNYADTHQREDDYLAPQQLPLVPGSEVAGRRADTGERVVALCGTGGYAELATAPEALVFPLPDGVEDGAALALLVQGLTAWHLLRTSARVQEGETVVVVAAAGGVGSLLVQLAAPFGAGRTIGLASTEEKRELARSLGADEVVDAAPDGLADRLREANGGRKVDVVLEMAGGEVFEQCLRALAPFGRLVAYGNASRQPNTAQVGALMARSQAIVGFWLVHALRDAATPMADLLGRVERGELRPVTSSAYPLADAAQAHIDLAGRRTTGKVLLDPTA